MTYIDRLNVFHQWCESNDLPVNAKLLYFNLLNVFNKAGWPRNLRVDTTRLMLMAGCQKDAAYRARGKLVEAGFITYKKGNKGSPSIYFLSGKTTVTATVTATESATVTATVTATQRERLKTKTKKEIFPPESPQGEAPPSADVESTGFEPALQEAFEQWLSYKRERREGYKPTGLRNLVTQIRNAAGEFGSGAVVSLIQQCMASGYKGIMFDRLKGQKRTDKQRPGGAAEKSYDIGELEKLSHLRLPDEL